MSHLYLHTPASLKVLVTSYYFYMQGRKPGVRAVGESGGSRGQDGQDFKPLFHLATCGTPWSFSSSTHVFCTFYCSLKTEAEAEVVTKSVECLPLMYEAQGSIPNAHISGMVAQPCIQPFGGEGWRIDHTSFPVRLNLGAVPSVVLWPRGSSLAAPFSFITPQHCLPEVLLGCFSVHLGKPKPV